MTLKKALILGLLLELVIGCLAATFYFKFYIYTPTYSIRAMQHAMEDGDGAALQKRVDVDGIFANGCTTLSQLVPESDPVYPKLKDGSFGTLCRDEFMTYVTAGAWPEAEEITPESSFQDKIGLKTIQFRDLEYVYPDQPEDGNALNSETIMDELLTYVFSLVKQHVFGEEDGGTAEDEVALNLTLELPKDVIAGVRVYEPNYGDTYLLRLKLHRQEDGSWKLTDILNYDDFAEKIIQQNDRDYTRYKDKVRMILTASQEKQDEMKANRDTGDMNWIFDMRNVLNESYGQLNALQVPVAGGYLNHLLKEREAYNHELLEDYYELAAQKEKMEDARKAGEEAQKNHRRNAFNEALWNSSLVADNNKIKAAEKKVADNRAALEKVLGRNLDRSIFAAQTAQSLRNNDDAAVRAANYPGAAESSSDDTGLTGGDNLPVVSAYDSLN